ncbi:response regulator [Paenibacillus provencensis]|uniref:Transcriptional regulatory protein n=1 Tax=Paenibacillus provencensis TaxID=441151 RepID=A0ABW3PXT1_9BACL|nr:response regulator [Paenibacillus sp. MER 78]MCM3128612.1 response regulator [Paenibacillus sp. MER 78]
MNQSPIEVMIVEDDPTAAKIYEQITHKQERFKVVATAATGSQALDLLEVYTPNLILLDVHLPDMNGMDLLRNVRQKNEKIDVILITAANDTETVSQAIHGGAFSYFIKPIMIDKFLIILSRYAEAFEQLTRKKTMEQEEVDRLFRAVGQGERFALKSQAEPTQLPKGIDRFTLKTMRETIKSIGKPVGADEVAELAGTSHSTARRYLEYMVSINELNVETVYGTVGRPERKYSWHLS